jgi:hypothetical protein
MAVLMAGVGRVTVSLRRSTGKRMSAPLRSEVSYWESIIIQNDYLRQIQ